MISAPLTHIINLLFRSGVFPTDSKIVKIWPLYKNGATVQFGNYRPISILPVISKVLDKIVHNRLVDYLSESKLLSKPQFGFRARRSTELAVTLLCDNVCKNVDSKQLTGCVFIDFSKAFGTVSDAKLLQKLNAFRIRNVELGWFSDYLFYRKQLVNYNDTFSDSDLLTCGVPQGSVLDIVDIMRYCIYSKKFKHH